MDALFGSTMPLAMRFFIAFLVVLALIGVTAWLVRRFSANRLGNAARGRQPRLAVIKRQRSSSPHCRTTYCKKQNMAGRCKNRLERSRPRWTNCEPWATI